MFSFEIEKVKKKSESTQTTLFNYTPQGSNLINFLQLQNHITR